MKATIYHNPKCSKSRNALEYLEKHNIAVDIQLYMDTGITRTELYDILELLNCDIKDIVRQDDDTLIDKYCSNMFFSKESLINAITTHPVLLERPIILFKEKGIGAVCRSDESLQSLFRYVGIDIKSKANPNHLKDQHSKI